MDTQRSLLTALDETGPHVMGGRYRYIPTTFDAIDEMRAFPLHFNWQWRSCRSFLEEMSSRGVISRLPTFWQANFAIFNACRDLRIPLYSNDPENVPLGASSLTSAGLDTLITSLRDMPDFIAYISEKRLEPPRSMLIVYRPEDTGAYIPAFSCEVRHEVHLMPGVPLLHQCQHIARESPVPPRYHISSDFSASSLNPLIVSSETLGPVSLQSTKTGIVLSAAGKCACGDDAYLRL